MKTFEEIFDEYYKGLTLKDALLKDPRFEELMKCIFYSGAYKYMTVIRNIANDCMNNKEEPSIAAQRVFNIDKDIMEFFEREI
jgi:hypothetical protein